MSGGEEPVRSAGPRDRRALAFAFIWFLVAAALLFAALWTGLVIPVSAVRVPVTLLIVLAGLAALTLASDGLERWWSSPRRKGLAGVLHWFSAAVVGLAAVVLLGAFAPSLAGSSPTSLGLLAFDLVLGAIAGLVTFLVTAGSARLAAALAGLASGLPGGDAPSSRLEAPLRDQLSLRDGARALASSVAGMLATTWSADHLVTWPAQRAADAPLHNPSAWRTVGVPLLAWFVGTGVVWLGLTVTGPLRPETHEARRRATHGSALAVGLAVVVGLLSASLLDSYVRGKLSSGPHPVPTVAGPLNSARAETLARDFAPHLVLARGEPWDPTTVNWYVENSQIITSRLRCHSPSNAREKDGCRTLKCPRGPDLSCATCDASDPGRCAPRGDPAQRHFYYQYLDSGTDKGDGPARPGHDWGVIQYGLFYNYDSLHSGLVTQWHQSDWEQVSVLVEQWRGGVRPVEVAFSEHCYGAVVPAAKVTWQGTHPVSFVGRGSHANYPTQNDLPVRFACLAGRPPAYLGAAGLLSNPQFNGSALELPIVNLIGLRDSTGGGERVTDAQPISARATPAIWGFHGYWGPDNNLHVLIGRSTTGPGPTSPQDQGPWTAPFRNMLCGPSWLKVDPVRRADTSWVC